MKTRKIQKVQDFKRLVVSRMTCFCLALFIAFIVNYFPLVLGASMIEWALLYIFFSTYAYFVNRVLYCLFFPKRITNADIDDFLIDENYSLDLKNKFKIATVNPFKMTANYHTRLMSKEKIVFVFDIRNNTYSCKMPKEKKQ